MAIGPNVVWEIRSTATASNANGGGFDPTSAGTDYSQQNAAQYSFTDLASTNGTTVPSVVTSASHSFVTADEGNLINITAGTNFTVSRFKIVSTSGGAATLDRAVGTAATLSGGTYTVGGALSLGAANDNTTLLSVAASNMIWVKAGSYTFGANISNPPNGGASLLTRMIGYNASRGDTPTGTNRPKITTSFTLTFNNNFSMANMIFSLATTITMNTGFGTLLNNVKVVCQGTGAALTPAGAINIFNSEFVCYQGTAVSMQSTGSLVGCYIHSSKTGVLIVGNSVDLIGCIVDGCYTTGVNNSGGTGSSITNCTLYGAENKLGIGITYANSLECNCFTNNIYYGFVTGISPLSAQTSLIEDYNNYFNNTTDIASSFITKGVNDIALNPGFLGVAQLTGATATTSGSVLTQAAGDFSTVTDNQDYVYISAGTGATVGYYLITSHTTTTITLDIAPGTNATANKVWAITTGRNWGVGANMASKGFPGNIAGAIPTTGYIDLGAAQTQSTDPGISNVKLATTYKINNTNLTGTLVASSTSASSFVGG